MVYMLLGSMYTQGSNGIPLLRNRYEDTQMKQGKTLTQLAAELERQQDKKRDFIAPTSLLQMLPDGRMAVDAKEVFDTELHFQNQIAAEYDISKKYWEKMPTELRAINVNHWLHKQPAKKMIRTLDGKARAFLSDKYRALDNFDLAEAVLPVLAEQPDMQIISTELTTERMYIKALFPRIQGEVAKGDLVQSGVVISNSEVGNGSLRVEPLVYRLVCLNGMISNIATRKYHVGRGAGDDFAREVMRTETMKATDKAFWMAIQDTVRASVDQAAFNRTVEAMAETQGWKIEADPIKVVERVQKHFTFNESETNGVLKHLLAGNDLTGYGLLNAITRTSQDIEDYTRATEFERIGGQIIDLTQNQWKRLAA